MSLLAPGALALSLLAIPIVAMYILKMRRPPRLVPSTFLWDQALHDVQANAPWQRLRSNLLLLLQLLALAVLVLALARPAVQRVAAAQGDIVAVLDGSMAMGATDVAPNRFAAARARIGTLIDGLAPGNVMSIVLMARRPRVLIAESADRAALHAALDAAATTYEPANPAAALAVAAALAHGGRHATLFVYHAAGGPAIVPPTTNTVAATPIETHVTIVGGTLRDLAIVAFAASRQPDGTVTLLARVVNAGQSYVAGNLQLDAASGEPGNLTWHNQVSLDPVALAPGGSAVFTRTWLPGDTTAVRGHLAAPDGHAIDDLAADDTAWAAVPAVTPRRVLLVTPGNRFLQLALSLVPGVTVETRPPETDTTAAARCADAAVFDSVLPAALPAASTSILAVAPPAGAQARALLGLDVAPAGAVAALLPGDQPPGDDLLAGSSSDSVAINSASVLGTPPWAYSVLRARPVSGPGTAGASALPVLVAGQNGARREVVLGFSIFNTNWALQPGFPLLVQNLLDYLAPPLSGPVAASRPGDPVSLAVAPCASTLTVVTPGGTRLPAAPPFPVQPFVGTGTPGLYTVEQQTPSGVRRSLFAVDPFPAPSLAVPGSGAHGTPPVAPAAPTPRVEVPLDLAPLVAALAIAVLCAEWVVAARRR